MWVRGARLEELVEGGAVCCQVQSHRIALFRWKGELYALDDACTHLGGPLSAGRVEDGFAVCPWHGARFDLRTGKAWSPPARGDLRSYPVRAAGGWAWIEIP